MNLELSLEITADDVLLMRKWLYDDDVVENLKGNKYDFEEILDEYFLKSDSTHLYVIKYDKETVGFIKAYPMDEDMCYQCEIDFSNSKDNWGIQIIIGEKSLWGKGIGTESVKVVCKKLLDSTKCSKIYLKTYPWHVNAIHCYEKSGFKISKILQNHIKYNGKMVDNVLMEYKN